MNSFWKAAIGAALALGLIIMARLIPPSQPKSPPPLVTRPAKFVTDIVKSEDTQDAAGGKIKATLMKGVRGGDWALAASGLTDDFVGRFPSVDEGVQPDSDGFKMREYPAEGRPDLGRDAFLAVLRSHTKGWVRVERTTWRMFEFLLDPDGNSAYASVHFQIAGPDADGNRGDLQGVVRARLVRSPDLWKAQRIEWVEGQRLDAVRPPFRDVTDLVGLHWNESAMSKQAFQVVINQRGSLTHGGLAAIDWDGDGFQDIAAVMNGKGGLVFRNDGKGGFLREPVPFTLPEEAGYAFTWADLDGDGLEELVTGSVLAYRGTRGWMAIYTRKGGAWTKLPEALEFETGPGLRELWVQYVIPSDIDSDGDLDLYVGVYANSNSRKEDFNVIAAYDGGQDLLFINHGGLKFTEEAKARGLVETQYSLAAAFFDFDGDGDQDILQGNDYGPNILWNNDGKGRYQKAKGHLFAELSGYTMGLSIADFENSGSWSVHVSNMYSHAGNRIIPLATAIDPKLKTAALALAAGDWIYEQDPKTGAWRDTTVERGIGFGDWAWACLFFDAENDGDKDMYVTNGFVSHEDPAKPDY